MPTLTFHAALRHALTPILLFFATTALAATPVHPAPTDSVAGDTAATALHAATVTATRLVFVSKKDTVVYNLDALAIAKGDMLGDVIAQMPGLTLRDGTLYFKGHAVNRLLVGGVDFVRGDTKQALANLPAYIIKSVKAYESLTEQARATGIDDGVREQVVDVILRREYLGTWTGNADIGGGTDERWRLRGFANTFTDNFRATAFGGFTNTGQYQYTDSQGSWSENGGAGSSSGNTKYMQPGASIMWHNKKKDDESGYLKLELSGGWDWRGHKDYGYWETETFLDDGTSTTTIYDYRTRDDEKIWRISPYLTYRPSRRSYLQYGPSLTFTSRTNRSHERSGTWDQPIFSQTASALDSLVANFNNGWAPATAAGSATNGILTESYNDLRKTEYSHWLYASQQLTDNNWRLALRSSVAALYGHTTDNTLKAYRYYQPTTTTMDPLYNRYTNQTEHSFKSQHFLDLNIPMHWLETMRFTYGLSYNDIRQRDLGYRLEQLGGLFADYADYLEAFGTLPTTADWQLLERDADVTMNSTTRTRHHWAENVMQYRRNGFFASLQNTVRFANEDLYYDKYTFDALHLARHATEYTLSTRLRYQNDSIGTFELTYLYENHPQQLSHGITIVDRSDPLNISMGNSDLRRARDHNTNARYDRTFRKGGWLSLTGNWTVHRNAVVSRSTYDKTTGVTTTQPTTICGNWSSNVGANYGRPLDRQQHFTLSLGSYLTMSNTENYTLATAGNPLRRRNTATRYSFNANLNGRSGPFNAQIGVAGQYISTHTTDLTSSTINSWQCSYTASAQYTLPLDITLRSNVNFRQRTGLASQTIGQWRTVWNADIAKSFLRDKTLTLRLEASDLLNQRDQSGIMITSQMRTAGYNMCVGRFFMLHVIYNFSTKKK